MYQNIFPGLLKYIHIHCLKHTSTFECPEDSENTGEGRDPRITEAGAVAGAGQSVA